MRRGEPCQQNGKGPRGFNGSRKRLLREASATAEAVTPTALAEYLPKQEIPYPLHSLSKSGWRQMDVPAGTDTDTIEAQPSSSEREDEA